MEIRSTIDFTEAVEQLWDCIVIGAGPGGSIAAIESVRRGQQTLLIDRATFPRSKVCGACLNARGQAVLAAVGHETLLRELSAVPLDEIVLRAAGRSLNLSLTGSVSVSRTAFDAALIRRAVETGVRFLSGTRAVINKLDLDPVEQQIEIQQSGVDGPSAAADELAVLRARVTVVADGLNHASLQRLTEFRGRVSNSSRIGLGGVVPGSESEFPAGRLSMGVGRSGYVGLVQLEDGRLNIAAAVDAELLKRVSSRGQALQAILSEAGFAPPPGMLDTHWQGTPALTRCLDPVAVPGVFVIGDAAGYVEPFTGEGMTWAMASGLAVGQFIERSNRHCADAARSGWQSTWKQMVVNRQRWCRRLSWLLRHPAGIGLTLSIVSRWPRLAQPILRTMNDSRLGVSKRTS